MTTIDLTYESYLRHIMARGVDKADRTGTGTRSVFGHQMRFNLADGFPLITTKKVHFKSIAVELLWFLRGDTNVRWLQERGVTIWNEWADANGDLGPVYGAQWRSWPDVRVFNSEDDTDAARFKQGGFKRLATDSTQHEVVEVHTGRRSIDQLAQVIDTIRRNPDSRRMLVTAWNPAQVDDMKLPPCHCLFQFYVADARLSCQLYQRSCDSFLGVPFNIASYALLTHLVAHQTGLEVGDFIWTGGDCHIYNNHFDQVREQLSRQVRPFPTLRILRKPDSIDGYEFEDFEIDGYNPHPAIKAPVAV